ncbi:hypothetical protein, conserved [Trypanosoma brucei gambiense DAL972]|uniref:Uncharacterized protein n=1 Tax=Trypanosoma brucei gambiense (strain MHOM/CI/86/DAL972) TaxID=679716 RepID=C9ZK76_TRYB9|nr:hypothetical protein, conserved [Trypanosoma brucei gambiense DAL972]CBH09840.1 hypothetical protein, conserved [Trypanosoma brucei gambiense DAL972]|eukprot:XP_011772133.1 hypothetical protein, conserved [Trypanosoma brucei gambiense DAL972]
MSKSLPPLESSSRGGEAARVGVYASHGPAATNALCVVTPRSTVNSNLRPQSAQRFLETEFTLGPLQDQSLPPYNDLEDPYLAPYWARREMLIRETAERREEMRRQKRLEQHRREVARRRFEERRQRELEELACRTGFATQRRVEAEELTSPKETTSGRKEVAKKRQRTVSSRATGSKKRAVATVPKPPKQKRPDTVGQRGGRPGACSSQGKGKTSSPPRIYYSRPLEKLMVAIAVLHLLLARHLHLQAPVKKRCNRTPPMLKMGRTLNLTVLDHRQGGLRDPAGKEERRRMMNRLLIQPRMIMVTNLKLPSLERKIPTLRIRKIPSRSGPAHHRRSLRNRRRMMQTRRMMNRLLIQPRMIMVTNLKASESGKKDPDTEDQKDTESERSRSSSKKPEDDEQKDEYTEELDKSQTSEKKDTEAEDQKDTESERSRSSSKKPEDDEQKDEYTEELDKSQTSEKKDTESEQSRSSSKKSESSAKLEGDKFEYGDELEGSPSSEKGEAVQQVVEDEHVNDQDVDELDSDAVKSEALDEASGADAAKDSADGASSKESSSKRTSRSSSSVSKGRKNASSSSSSIGSEELSGNDVARASGTGEDEIEDEA